MLLRLLGRHDELMEQLVHTPPILRGTVSRIHTRCGKPTCWCAQSSQGHPHVRIAWSENGKLLTRKVPADQLERIEELTESYRCFRSQRRQLLALQSRIRDLLDSYEKTLSAQIRQPLPFLAIGAKMAGRTQVQLRNSGESGKGES